MKRVAIISRVPITSCLINNCKARLQTLELMGEATEYDILELSRYYDYKARQVEKTTGFKSLPKYDYKQAKNWIPFCKVMKLCLENNFDYRIYVDSQFERASHWEHTKRPFVTQMYAYSSFSYYENYVSRMTEILEAEGKTLKAKDIVSVNDEIANALYRDCKLLATGLKFTSKTEWDKVNLLTDNILSLSPYYIISSSWLTEAALELLNINSSLVNKDKIKTIKRIIKNKKIMTFVAETLSDLEKTFSIPRTITEQELLDDEL